jgi:7-cyano-7-deazaguanine synthase
VTRKHSVLLFSGGVDSTLALHWALSERRVVHVLEIDFPDRPSGEMKAATRILRTLRPAAAYRLEVPFLHASKDGPAGYLPTRNLLYHAIAQSLAESLGAGSVVAGHLQEDAEGFPDADPRFFSQVERLAARGRPDGKRVTIENPLAAQSVESLAETLPVPLEWTWSCWAGGSKQCGRCEKCVRRAELLERFSRPRKTVSAARTPKANRAPRG